jgi:hypothetical protein
VQLVSNGAAEISRRMGYLPAASVTATLGDSDASNIAHRQVS